MFQFSKWLRKKSSLWKWEAWFKEKGIQTEIRVINYQDRPYYSLWREGIEAKGEKK